MSTLAPLPIKALKTLRKRLLENGEALAQTMWRELGKPWGDSFTAEIIADADLIDQWCKHGPRLLKPRKVALDPLSYAKKEVRIELAPKGSILLITPWNMPVAIPLRTIVPALLAGNRVLWKPSEYAQETSAQLFKLFDGLGLPLELHQGDGSVAQKLLAEHAIDHIAFTGSVATGRALEKVALEKHISISAELGGKDAAIVLDDAPFERTVQGVMWGAFNMSGQNCSSIERVIVTRGIAQKLTDALVVETKKLRFGEKETIDTADIGPLANDKQLGIVKAHVADAVAKGARVLIGGDANGRHFAPTVLADVPVTAQIWTDETFGPVLPIVIVENADAALKLANDSRYGLGGSVWTNDIAKGEQIARAMNTGVAMVNNACFTGAIAMTPWTGIKDSGHGATNSEFALYELTRPRTIVIDRSKAARELWWYPFTPSFRTLGLALARFLRGELSALFSVLKWMPKRWKT